MLPPRVLESNWQTHLEIQHLLREDPIDWQPLVEPSKGPGARLLPCLPEPGSCLSHHHLAEGGLQISLGICLPGSSFWYFPFACLESPHHLASPPGIRSGPVTHPTCLPLQILDAPHSAQAMSVPIELESISMHVRLCMCAWAHTHRHTHRKSFTFSTLYNICTPPTKAVSKLNPPMNGTELPVFLHSEL